MTVPYMKLWTTITHTLRFYDSAIGEKLRAVTPISIATLIVSIAALVLIIILFVADSRDSSEHDFKYSPDLTVPMIQTLIENHANLLIKANGITDENIENMSLIPGWGCFWSQRIFDGKARAAAKAGDTPSQSYNYNSVKDVWFITSVDLFCENGIETWTVDDNSGGITYGRSDK